MSLLDDNGWGGLQVMSIKSDPPEFQTRAAR